MKSEDLKQLSEFAGDAQELALSLLTPMLDERLTDQPVEAYAVYIANIRWATYQAIEALGRLKRIAETTAPLWADPPTEVSKELVRKMEDIHNGR